MEPRAFKPEMLLIIALPIVLSFLGGTYLNDGTNAFVNTAGGRTITQFHIYMGMSLLFSTIGFFTYWGKKNLAFISMILLPVLLTVAILMYTREKISAFALFIPLLFMTGSSYLILRYVFYNKAFLRFRTILSSLSGALVMSVYFRLQYLLMNVSVEPGFWMNRFVSSLLLFIFITLGMSLADMFIVNKELREANYIRRQKILSDEIDDEDDDAL
ncbi:MAG TPA: hypothetical protein PLX59_05400 [Candidatus Cloacimonadota bacterium]|nr:hypothetical protein [Candidatus Cloacimonadota bacterium]